MWVKTKNYPLCSPQTLLAECPHPPCFCVSQLKFWCGYKPRPPTHYALVYSPGARLYTALSKQLLLSWCSLRSKWCSIRPRPSNSERTLTRCGRDLKYHKRRETSSMALILGIPLRSSPMWVISAMRCIPTLMVGHGGMGNGVYVWSYVCVWTGKC